MTSDNKLKKVSDTQTIYGLIGGAKERSAEVFIWRLVGNRKYLAQVRIESIRKQRKDFCITPGEGQDRDVQELIVGQSYIDVYIPDSALLFRCHIKSTDAPVRYYLQMPDFVAQVERRKNLRLNTYESSEVKLSFGKSVSLPRPMTQHFYKDCFDISVGGFSFFVSKMESKFFVENDYVTTIEIMAGTWRTKISAEVVTIREVEPDEFNGLSYKVWRVSCRMINLDQISRKYLEKFIFERIKDELHVING